jgi:proteasome accessory factor B
MKRVLERLLNLLVYLRTSNEGITVDDIRFTVPGYDTSNDIAFHRMFERDKELLRGMGISLTAEQEEDGRIAYFLRPDEYELADPGLTDEEQIALWLATRMVQLDCDCWRRLRDSCLALGCSWGATASELSVQRTRSHR